MHRRTLLLLAGVGLLVALWVSQASTVGRPEGCLAGCATRDRTPGHLRLLSMNVLHGFPTFERLGERLDLVADEIIRRDADVALLQEVPWVIGTGSGVERIARRTGMNHVFLRANGNRFAIGFEEGSVILSRFALRDPAWLELAPSAGPFEHRVALAATADTPWGDLRLVVTHLSGDQAANRGQAASLAGWLGPSQEPMVIGGDFNADPDSATYRDLAATWTDAYRAVNHRDPGWTCCLDELEATPGAAMRDRVDYVFASRTDSLAPRALAVEVVLVEPVRVGEGWLRASDHAGLYVELALDSPAT